MRGYESTSNLTKEIREFITHLYSFTYIPIYYYSGSELSFCIPAEAIDYLPPKTYLNAFLSFPHTSSYQMTDFGAMYGYVKDAGRNGYYVIGPCSSVPYDSSTVFSMRREFNVREAGEKKFTGFLKAIPRKHDNDFISILSFISYCANMESDTPHDLMCEDIEEEARSIDHNFIEMHVNSKDYQEENNSLDIEEKLLAFIETGDIDGLREFFGSTLNVSAGTIAGTSLRNTKNMMIVTTALSCRAAIKGGLSPDLAFHLSDSYIQQAEASNSIEVIQGIVNKMLFDYTERVSGTLQNLHGDPVLQKVIRYVQHNTNKRITVDDVAAYIGLSRGYLSTFFKKNLGFELSSFIRRCKLEEAKDMLRHSERSISEISNYLCFSSQSHFQNCFKKQYKITPQQFRHGVDPE